MVLMQPVGLIDFNRSLRHGMDVAKAASFIELGRDFGNQLAAGAKMCKSKSAFESSLIDVESFQSAKW